MISLTPIISGLIGCVIVLLLMRTGRKPAKQDGSTRLLCYGTGTKCVVMLIIPLTMFIGYASSYGRPDQIFPARCLGIFFIAASLFLTYQVFMVRLGYDDTAVYYSSPLAGSHIIPWGEVEYIGWSSLCQSYYICTVPVRRIWWSPMMEGYEQFGRFLEQKFPQKGGSFDDGTSGLN